MKTLFLKKHDHGVTYLMLHGTGGNEKDLIPLVERIDPYANVFGVLGEVSENGMARYFKRLAEGVFDEADLDFRTDRLHALVLEKCHEFEVDLHKLIVIGYSNGANMAQSLLLRHPPTYKTMILLHPMNVKKSVAFADLSHVSVFIGAGKFDPICPIAETLLLEQRLKTAHAKVHVSVSETDHRITLDEVMQIKRWIEHIK